MSKNMLPTPLYRDPIYDGATDPTIIYNNIEDKWWLIYTSRRASSQPIGHSWVHGSALGVASSSDGYEWTYRGTIPNLDIEPGHNTFWAPEVIEYQGKYHMYVTYIQGIPTDWAGHERNILHYTSDNMWDWSFQSKLQLSSSYVIDAAIHPHPDGTWRMWYKDEAKNSSTWVAKSEDLYKWEVIGQVLDEYPHEGANVFFWKSYYWLIVDCWKGQVVYQSKNCDDWQEQTVILQEFGMREDDGDYGRHADVLVTDDEKAYIFYFTHPDVHGDMDEQSYASRRSSIQVGELSLENGIMTCHRNEVVQLELGTTS
ncbi:glycosyl hydrolase [Salipaludibacillus sp. HK11]|uniref:glycosyl hydrolase n=1 Tax=Salipaludibacillus sp. HK11 TaxID=3394320 RepID=UPI0039FCB48C